MGKDPPKAVRDEIEESRLGQELDRLYRFAGTVGSNLDVNTLLKDAHSQLLSMAGAQKILIVLLPAEGSDKLLINQFGWTDLGDFKCEESCIEELGVDTVCGVGKDNFPASFEHPLTQEQEPWALVPLLAYGRQLGFIFFVRESEPFDSSTLKLLNTAGRQLAIATENSRLFEDVQSSYRRMIDAQEELIQSERLAALGGLAATMAHEIRNPLTTILSSLSQIRKHANVIGDTATLLEIAEEESLRLNSMIGGLLEFARPKMPRLGEVQPVEMVSELIAVTSNLGDFPEGVTLKLESTADGIIAKLDPELFRQAIQLCVSNSLAAVEPRTGQILIGVHRDDSSVSDLEITVADNGSGIEPELQNSVFEPFFTTKPSGTGLGLPVVKRIVEDHGGSVELDSSPGNGTRIKLLFKKAALNVN